MDNHMYDQLTASEVAGFLDKGEGVLIDTLPPEHFENRHIPGAINACVYEMVFVDSVERISSDRTRPIVLYGAGVKSKDCVTAADKLIRAGFEDVAVFPGGLCEWSADGNVLEGLNPMSVLPPNPILSLEARKYSLVLDESRIQWKGRNNSGSHTGDLQFSAGALDATHALAATFTIDMTSIRNTDLHGDPSQGLLLTHLHSDDFFFTKLFPEATFTSTKIRTVQDGEATRPNGMIQGILGLRGMQSEIAFPVHIRNLDGEKIGVIGNVDIDRTHWGIIYGSSRFFQYLGYHVVYDFISVDFRLVLQ